MRRKSERTTKSSPNPKRTENVTRRTTRRNKKSPEKIINEEGSVNSSDQASSSENEVEEVVASKRGKRTNRIEKLTLDDVKDKASRPKRKTLANKKDLEASEEDCPIADTSAEDTAKKQFHAEASTNQIKETNVDSSIAPADEPSDGNCPENNAEMSEQLVPVEKANEADGEKITEPNVSATETAHSDDDKCIKQSTSKERPRIRMPKILETIPDATDKTVEKDSPATTTTTTKVVSNADTNETKELAAVETTSTNKSNDLSATETTSIVKNKNSSEKEDDAKDENSDKTKLESENGAARSNKALQENSLVNTTINDSQMNENNTSSKSNKKKPIVRKRKWLSNKSSAPKIQEIAISTDSLKGLISDVKPVPLCDVKLDSSSDVDQESDDVKVVSSTSLDYSRRSEERPFVETTEEPTTLNISTTRKVSIVHDHGEPQPPSPAKHNPCNILYITNLVRPFTALQLKGLLLRTGKIVENGFWMDKIKSKCFVKYETEDEAVETRHALHGIRWPSSNPKCLNVDFGTESLMEKAILSTATEAKPIVLSRDERMVSSNDHYDHNRDKVTAAEKPIREWDLGKKADSHRSREQERSEKERDYGRSRENNRDIGREKDRERDRNDRRRRSASASPSRKYSKKDNEPPLRLLDDLFRKTRTTPCIYWLPLTPEQIAVREEERLKQIAENQRRMEAMKKERNERDRNGGSNEDRKRERNRGARARDRDREKRRPDQSSRSSRDRDRSRRY